MFVRGREFVGQNEFILKMRILLRNFQSPTVNCYVYSTSVSKHFQEFSFPCLDLKDSFVINMIFILTDLQTVGTNKQPTYFFFNGFYCRLSREGQVWWLFSTVLVHQWWSVNANSQGEMFFKKDFFLKVRAALNCNIPEIENGGVTRVKHIQ